jgi:hypothetical protein
MSCESAESFGRASLEITTLFFPMNQMIHSVSSESPRVTDRRRTWEAFSEVNESMRRVCEGNEAREVEGVGKVDQVANVLRREAREGFRGARIKKINQIRNYGFREQGEIHLQKFRTLGVDDAAVPIRGDDGERNFGFS